MGGITYLMKTNEVHRAKINPSSYKVESEMIFRIPITSNDTASILDVVVANENYTIVLYDNDTVSAYIRPKELKGFAVRSNSGSIVLATDQDNPLYFFTPVLNLTGDRSR